MDRRPWHNGFQCRMHVLDRCPLGEPLIAAPEHPDLPVTPWLLADPVNYPIGVLSFNLPGPNLVPAAAFTARICHHSHVAVHGGLPRLAHFVQTGVDREIERCRLPPTDVLAAHNQGTERRAVSSIDPLIALDDVSFRVVFPYQRISEGD